jgi:hypothetical protein
MTLMHFQCECDRDALSLETPNLADAVRRADIVVAAEHPKAKRQPLPY